MRPVAIACVAVLGCGSSSAAPAGAPQGGSAGPVTSFAGELHLHQFPDGSPVWAAFLGDPVPISALQGDSVTEVDTAITAVEGPCTLYVLPTCSPDCGGADYREAANRCAP